MPIVTSCWLSSLNRKKSGSEIAALSDRTVAESLADAERSVHVFNFAVEDAQVVRGGKRVVAFDFCAVDRCHNRGIDDKRVVELDIRTGRIRFGSETHVVVDTRCQPCF